MFDPNKVETVGPAKTLAEFRDRLAICKANLIKSMTVTRELMSQLLKSHKLPDTGYIIYENVWLYEEGKEEDSVRRDMRTVDDILFGQSKVGISQDAMINSKAVEAPKS